MTYSVIYLDDDPKAEILSDGFNTTGLIKSKWIKPSNFEQQLAELKEEKFDGIILDLKLDENLAGDRKAYYSATSLAQQLRTACIENEFDKEFPIILFTSQENLTNIYKGDISSHNLFDLYVTKNRITEERVQREIRSLIDAYAKISDSKGDLSKILGLKDVSRLDSRIFASAELNEEKNSIYSIANFILDELICLPGPLINEKYLAARLGIDIDKSGDWVDLKKCVADTKYSGIYGEEWERWWMYRLNDWWENKIDSSPLASMDARKKVELLSAKLKLSSLSVSQPIKRTASYRFWTLCEGYGLPLDPREGFKIESKDPLTWQDTRYISLDAALERVRRDEGLKVHPSEKERFDHIKNSLK